MSGSFSPRFRQIAQRSIFTVYSNGTLTLNFGWLKDNEETKHYGDELGKRLSTLPGLDLPSNYRDTYIYLNAEKWVPVAGRVVEAVQALLDEAATRAVVPRA